MNRTPYIEPHMIRTLLLIVGVLLMTIHSFCQTSELPGTKNIIMLEGASLVYIGHYTISYERNVLSTEAYKLNINTGIGGWYFFPISRIYSGYSIPLSLNSLIGKGNNHLEIDLGARYTFLKERIVQQNQEADLNHISKVFPVINLGYRYQRPDRKGLTFRAFIGLSGIGIGVGKAF